MQLKGLDMAQFTSFPVVTQLFSGTEIPYYLNSLRTFV